jgi:uncharacterized protein YdeI (YjbR/CyaY-like superfamily)
MEAIFFATPEELRAWLDANHATARELWIGFYKKGAGRAGISYAQAVDEALCAGWIDGVRKTLDGESYVNRFTPRQARSVWSAVNIARATELEAEGRLRPAGRAAFAARAAGQDRQYAYEREAATLPPAAEATFRANAPAWAFFQAQAPWYQRAAIWWVVSAKQEATRARRLATLIADSAAGRRLPALTSPARR